MRACCVVHDYITSGLKVRIGVIRTMVDEDACMQDLARLFLRTFFALLLSSLWLGSSHANPFNSCITGGIPVAQALIQPGGLSASLVKYQTIVESTLFLRMAALDPLQKGLPSAKPIILEATCTLISCDLCITNAHVAVSASTSDLGFFAVPTLDFRAEPDLKRLPKFIVNKIAVHEDAMRLAARANPQTLGEINYLAGDPEFQDVDLAILKFDANLCARKTGANFNYKPIKIANPTEVEKSRATSQKMIIFGYGRQEPGDGKSNGVLKTATTINRPEEKYGDWIDAGGRPRAADNGLSNGMSPVLHDEMISYKHDTARKARGSFVLGRSDGGSCKSDSGGGVAVETVSGLELVGILSAVQPGCLGKSYAPELDSYNQEVLSRMIDAIGSSFPNPLKRP